MHKLNNSRALVTREAYLDPTSKLAADTFEVVAAEVFMNANFETFRAWVGRVFRPLIQVATETFLRYVFFFFARSDSPVVGICFLRVYHSVLGTPTVSANGRESESRMNIESSPQPLEPELKLLCPL
jgi:hypothetical protein